MANPTFVIRYGTLTDINDRKLTYRFGALGTCDTY